ncbi:MAG: NAD(P)/FAD-dependent oxidoreductase [Chthoniobacterales bacterium]
MSKTSAAYDVIVIGGGAAGLFCASVAGKRGRRVAVLEHNQRPGNKILISGGGRCNFTNTRASWENYLSENPRFCCSAMARFTPSDFIALVEKHGIRYHEKTLGQLFCDKSSRQILEMLLEECEEAGVQIFTSCHVQEVKRTDGFYVQTSSEELQAQSLVIATGGLSFSNLGASDFAYRLAKQFELPVISPRPGLVPLRFSEEDKRLFESLSGVSLPVRTVFGKREFSEAALFTHRGMSGPAVLQISSYWQAGEKVYFDLLPGEKEKGWLASRRGGQRKLSALLAQHWPRRFAERWSDLYAPQKNPAQFSQEELLKTDQLLHAWPVNFNGSEGYTKAEVTCGGVDTKSLSSKTMEAQSVPGLYFIGEAVDVTGWLGGYNFQWAWASGHAAGVVC